MLKSQKARPLRLHILIVLRTLGVQIIAMLFTGTAPLYLMSTTYVLVGARLPQALLGCPMGGEFKAALQAAWQVQTFRQPLACALSRGNIVGYLWGRQLGVIS